MNHFVISAVFCGWVETHHEGILTTPPRHICEGDLSLGDIKRRLLAQASDYGVSYREMEQVSKVAHDTGMIPVLRL